MISDKKEEQPLLLSMDCASKSCSVSLHRGQKLLCEITTDTDKTHSLTLLPSVEQALAFAGLTPADLDAVAVTAGPGSFTGLKIGVAAAKGIAFPKDLPCYPVSSMSALAYGALPFEGLIAASFDARRGMLYNAVFRSENGRLRRLTPDRQSSSAELAAELLSLTEKEKLPLLLTGDGQTLLAPFFGEEVLLGENGIRARGIALAVFAGETEKTEAAKLTPDYLRPSQAERERAEREAAKKKTEDRL